jgi:hypothetical protein
MNRVDLWVSGSDSWDTSAAVGFVKGLLLQFRRLLYTMKWFTIKRHSEEKSDWERPFDAQFLS